MINRGKINVNRVIKRGQSWYLFYERGARREVPRKFSSEVGQPWKIASCHNNSFVETLSGFAQSNVSQLWTRRQLFFVLVSKQKKFSFPQHETL